MNVEANAETGKVEVEVEVEADVDDDERQCVAELLTAALTN